ncbi:MAG: cysteine hydrolase family protein [Bacillota bacterium]
MNPALVIIDMQNYFFDNEKREIALPSLVDAINNLIEWAKDHEIPIFQVITIHKKDRSTWNLMMKENDYVALIDGTKEAKIVSGIDYDESQILIKKTRQDTFIKTNFEDKLEELNIDTLIFSGVFTHGCVGRSAITAYQKDYKTIISEEATFSDRPNHEKVMFEVIENEQQQFIMTNKEIKEFIIDEVLKEQSNEKSK